MEHTLDAYKFSINYWNQCRISADTVTALIADGHYFHITRDMYDFWININPEYIHAYVGVDAVPYSKIGFILIDSTNDSNPDTVTIENIFYAPYRYGFDSMQTIPTFAANGVPNMNVGILAGLERSFRWNLNRKNWIETKIAEGASETSGIFQAIHIPMSDLNSIFGEGDAQTAVVVFGLKEDNTVELLVWSEDFNVQEDVEDVARPIPPFGNIDNYNLLKIALGV